MPSPRLEIHALLTASSPAAALDRLRVWEAEIEARRGGLPPGWGQAVVRVFEAEGVAVRARRAGVGGMELAWLARAVGRAWDGLEGLGCDENR